MNTTPWLDELTATFLGTVDTLTDDEFTAPTALPGWTRAHVVAHVHFNALALRRLVSWARTGEETPMYASPSQRAEEIDRGAEETPGLPPHAGARLGPRAWRRLRGPVDRHSSSGRS